MTKHRKCLDDHQTRLNFDSPIDAYQAIRDELLAVNAPPAAPQEAYGYEECCNEIAVAIKRAIRESGLSRENVVDLVNGFFGWPADADGRERLTIHMLNNYLCRPSSYNMPIPYLHAIQRVTGSLEPLRCLADMEGVQIVTDEEAKMLALGKIETALMEFQKLKKTFKGKVSL